MCMQGTFSFHSACLPSLYVTCITTTLCVIAIKTLCSAGTGTFSNNAMNMNDCVK